jgi:hypothetical protein
MAGITIPLPYMAMHDAPTAYSTPFFGTVRVGPLAQASAVAASIQADLRAAAVAGRRSGGAPPSGSVLRLEAASGGRIVPLPAGAAVFGELSEKRKNVLARFSRRPRPSLIILSSTLSLSLSGALAAMGPGATLRAILEDPVVTVARHEAETEAAQQVVAVRRYQQDAAAVAAAAAAAQWAAAEAQRVEKGAVRQAALPPPAAVAAAVAALASLPPAAMAALISSLAAGGHMAGQAGPPTVPPPQQAVFQHAFAALTHQQQRPQPQPVRPTTTDRLDALAALAAADTEDMEEEEDEPQQQQAAAAGPPPAPRPPPPPLPPRPTPPPQQPPPPRPLNDFRSCVPLVRPGELALPPDAAPSLLAAARCRPQPPGARPIITLVPAAVTDPAGGVWACEWAHNAGSGVHGLVGEAWASFVRAWGGGGASAAAASPSLVVLEGKGLPPTVAGGRGSGGGGAAARAAAASPVVGITAAIVDAATGAPRVAVPVGGAALFGARAAAALAGAAAALEAETEAAGRAV